MKIVVDTNVVISGVFFGGYPRTIIEAIADGSLVACATVDIISEYDAVIREMVSRKQGHLRKDILTPLIRRLQIVTSKSDINICRDPDDNKFISCAVDVRALYIVSGDKDLLSIGDYGGVSIITAIEFCDLYLLDN